MTTRGRIANGAPKTRARLDWDGARRRLAAVAKSSEVLQQEAKQVLAERAMRLATALQSTANEQVWLEILLFRRGERRFAIESRFLIEVSVCGRMSRVPGAGSALLGIMNLRGDLLPVFELSALDGVTERDQPMNAQLVVLGQKGPELALLADAVDEVTRIATSSLVEARSVGALPHPEYVRGITADGCQLLDGEAILQDRSLFVARRPNGTHQKREAT
jgi:purine-binding chemotaxis protein CheW